MIILNNKNRNRKVKYLLTVIIALIAIPAQSQVSSDSTGKTILLRHKTHNAIEMIKGDTVSADTSRRSVPTLPGGPIGTYTPEQDSAYSNALRLRISPGTRLLHDLQASAVEWQIRKQMLYDTPWEFALKNMSDIPREQLLPSPIEMVQHQINIMNSFYVPFVSTYKPYGIKISMGKIASMLGLTEDVTPEIKYKLDFTANVEVVIYSVQAAVIATVFKGRQQTGSYVLWWNGRDDYGKKMPPGDYIAEVRIEGVGYYRKRIIL